MNITKLCSMKMDKCFILLVSFVILAIVLIMSFWSSDSRSQMVHPFAPAIVTKDNHKSQLAPPSPTTGLNILAVYTGRWNFIRIQLPHVYRELRCNGGILDEVWFNDD